MVVQAALLVPSLLRSDLHIRFRWQPGHEAMRRITRLAGWTFGIVLANQVALVVVLALADGARVPGAVSAYTYAYTFFQLPYGVVAVSVMSAVTPSLSARWAEGDIAAFRHRMAFGLRSILAMIIPSAVGMIILAHPLIDLVLAHGAETVGRGVPTAAALAMFALGLPGFCTFLYMVRVLQAMQDTRTAFRIYLVENAINIVLGVALVGPLGVRGLALSVSIAYTVAAVHRPVAWCRRKEGGLGGHEPDHPGHPGAGRHRGHGRGHRAGRQRVAGPPPGSPCWPGWSSPWWWAWWPSSGPPWSSPPATPGAATDGRGAAARAERPASPAGPPSRRRCPDAEPVDAGRTPRRGRRTTSIRLVDPASADVRPPGDAGADVRSEPAGGRTPTTRPSAIPFRGRLDDGSDDAPVRHLRPVPDGRGRCPRAPGGDRAIGGDPVEDTEGDRPPDDEEDPHGPDPGGDR